MLRDDVSDVRLVKIKVKTYRNKDDLALPALSTSLDDHTSTTYPRSR